MWVACPECEARVDVPQLDLALSQVLVSCACGVAGKLELHVTRSRWDAKVRALVDRVRVELENDRLKLPALPDVVVRVEQTVREGKAGAAEIAKMVEGDPVLTTKLLRLANSVLFRGRMETRTVQQAIARLGMQNLRDYVLAILSRELFVVEDASLMELIKRLWGHAITVAVAARELAGHVPAGEGGAKIDPDLAFISGLLHDMGKAVLVRMTSKVMARLLKAGDDAKVRAVFESLHTVAGGLVLKHWELPNEAVLVAAHHHDEEIPEAARSAGPVIDVVVLANRMAQQLGYDIRPEQPGLPPLAASPQAQRLGLSEVAIADVEVTLEDRAAEMSSII